MRTASTPDPDRVSARRRCLSVAGHCSSGWDLGVYIDADVTMRTHVTNTVRACFAALCQISSVQRALPQHALPHAGPSSSCHQVGPVRLGSCGYFWVSAGPTAVSAQCRRWARMSEHTTPLLQVLHWLRVPERIQFGCVFWRITVCMAQHQRIWQTACGRH